MRRLTPWAVAAALLAGGLFFATRSHLLRAEDEEPSEPAAEVTEEPRTIEFVDGLAAGAEAARESDRLVFVYVGRHTPT